MEFLFDELVAFDLEVLGGYGVLGFGEFGLGDECWDFD
jgi:hypothetical protein